MKDVLLVVHLLIAVAMVGLVLMQKSEGGALGMGGGGGGGGFLTGRGTANLLTRTTAILAAAFFATSLGLTLLGQPQSRPGSIFDTPAATAPATPGGAPTAPAPTPTAGAPATPAAPGEAAPAVPGGTTTTPAPAAPAAPRGGILDKLQQNPAGRPNQSR